MGVINIMFCSSSSEMAYAIITLNFQIFLSILIEEKFKNIDQKHQKHETKLYFVIVVGL